MATRSPSTRRIPPWVAWLVAQGVLNSVFCRLTVFGAIFILFLDDLGISKSRTGVLLSLIPFSHLLGLVVGPLVARIGFKRAYLIGFGARKIPAALIMLTPVVIARYGDSAAFAWVAGNILVFAAARAFGEMGMYPWFQEVIPNAVRGRIGGVTGTFGTIAGLIASGIAGPIINEGVGLGRYLGAMGVGVVLGLISVACLLFIPGGAPVARQADAPAHPEAMLEALRDRNYRRFLIGLSLVNFSIGALLTFSPLYMREMVGLPPGSIVMLEVAGSVGGLIAGYPSGRAADRRGSRPVVVASVGLLALLPVFWAVVPRHSPHSLVAAMALSLAIGIAYTAWLLASDRYLNVNAVPPDRRTPYVGVFYPVAGLSAAFGPLVAGRLIDAFAWLRGDASAPWLNPFTPLFVLTLVLLLVALRVCAGLRNEEAMPVGRRLAVEPEPAEEGLPHVRA